MAAGTSNSRCVGPPDQTGVAKWVRDQDRETKQNPVCQKFSAIDVLFVITSLITYVFDLVTDCLLAWQYFHAGHSMCGMWTLVFVVIPTLTLQIISLRWYHIEKRQLCCSWTLAAHFALLGPVERYISVLRYGLSARSSERPESYQRLYQAQNDVSTLRLIEAFLESAPQLILQGYFSLTTQPVNWLSGLSMAVSLLSLAWAVAVYSNTLRLAYRASHMTNWCGLVVQSLWHTCIVASRVTAIVSFATLFHGWTFLPVGVHWLLMTVWVMIQGPDFFTRWWENKLFSLVLGVIFIFCFFNLKDGHTRHKMWPFYILLLAENGVLAGLWYSERPQLDTLMIVVTSIIFGGYVSGVMLMLFYYRCCHPSGPLYLCGEEKPEVDLQSSAEDEPHRRRVFDASLMSRSPMFSIEGYDLSLESSWSGLVDSRRADTCNPTFTASRYNTSPQQLHHEHKTLERNPNSPCNKLFDTPLWGGSTVDVHSARDQSQLGEQNRLSWACSDSNPVCNTIPLAQSECSAISESNFSGSQLGCVSLDYSTRSRSKSQAGYDNAGFSISSVMSSTVSKNLGTSSRFPKGHSVPSAALSLPSVYPLSSTHIGVDNQQNSSHGHHSSSVFAITGTPGSSSRSSSNLKQDTSPVGPRVSQTRKLEQKNTRRFDHTQSLQCIPQDRPVFNSSTLPLKTKMPKSKIWTSRESLSSISSCHKPRPLSPLNAQSLWEESRVRFNQSFEDEIENSNCGKSENSANCSKDLRNDLSHSSHSVTRIVPRNKSHQDIRGSSGQDISSSFLTNSSSKVLSMENISPANNTDYQNSERSQNASNYHDSSNSLQSPINRSTISSISSVNVSSHSGYSKQTPRKDSLLSTSHDSSLPNSLPSNAACVSSSGDTPSRSSIETHSTSCSPYLSSSNNSGNNSRFSNYSSTGISHNSSQSKPHSQNGSTSLSSQYCSSPDSPSVACSIQSSASENFSSYSTSKHSSCSQINSSTFSSKNSSSTLTTNIYSDNSSSLHSPSLKSVKNSSDVYSKKHSSSSYDSSQLSTSSNSPMSKIYDHLSSEGHRTDSSGFQSSAVDDSIDFFDYSDDYKNQLSKQTLYDLAQRLNLVLDLNTTTGDKVSSDSIPANRFLPFKDTPWRTDYLSRIPTPILSQSRLSLYSASAQSLYNVSDLHLNGSSRAMSRSAFLTTSRTRQDGYPSTTKPECQTPLKIYDLTKSPGSKPRFKQGLKQLPPQPSELRLENYGNSPYRMIKNSRKGCDNEQRSKKYAEDNRRSSYEVENPARDKGLSKSSISTKSFMSDPDTECGRRFSGLSSSNSEMWAEVSCSEKAENIDPSVLSSYSSKHSLESPHTYSLHSTPDFSPIPRFELPPLTAGTGPLKPRQSYFSTPKAVIPGYDSPSDIQDNNCTNDSFFGIKVPQMTKAVRQMDAETQKLRPDINNADYKYSTTPRNNSQRYRPVRF